MLNEICYEQRGAFGKILYDCEFGIRFPRNEISLLILFWYQNAEIIPNCDIWVESHITLHHIHPIFNKSQANTYNSPGLKRWNFSIWFSFVSNCIIPRWCGISGSRSQNVELDDEIVRKLETNNKKKLNDLFFNPLMLQPNNFSRCFAVHFSLLMKMVM